MSASPMSNRRIPPSCVPLTSQFDAAVPPQAGVQPLSCAAYSPVGTGCRVQCSPSRERPIRPQVQGAGYSVALAVSGPFARRRLGAARCCLPPTGTGYRSPADATATAIAQHGQRSSRRRPPPRLAAVARQSMGVAQWWRRRWMRQPWPAEMRARSWAAAGSVPKPPPKPPPPPWR